MAIHDDLPIHRTGVKLLDLAIRAQVDMPRSVKRLLGEKITQHCVEMLDLMALANLSKHDVRAGYIDQLLTRQRAMTVLMRVSHDARYISPGLWAESIALLSSMPAEDLHQSGNSYFGQVRQASHSHFDQVKLARLLLKRGHSVKGDLTKIYRKSKPKFSNH